MQEAYRRSRFGARLLQRTTRDTRDDTNGADSSVRQEVDRGLRKGKGTEMIEGIVVVSATANRAATWFEQRSCRGKVQFATRWEARAAARDIVRRVGGTVMPYHCRFCDGWHAGHPMKAGR